MLQARGLSFSVKGRTLIDNVNAEFAVGELSILLGANGAGKSTLVRLLARQITGQKGSVRYDGEPSEGWKGEELARVRAVLSQHVEVSFPLRVREVVMMGRYPHFTGAPTARDRRACNESMERLGVLDWADRDYLTLSGGERQRVQFARVLAQIWQDTPGKIRWLLLDEPLTFLDIRHQLEFLKLVRELLTAGDLVAVGAVHDLNLAARFADHCVLLADGRVLAAGAASEVLTPELVTSGFGITPVIHKEDDGRVRLEFN